MIKNIKEKVTGEKTTIVGIVFNAEKNPEKCRFGSFADFCT